MAVEFKIMYDDRSTRTNEDGNIASHPSRGVIYVLQWDETFTPRKRRTLRGGDFYVRRNDFWWTTDQFGLMDMMIRMGHLTRVNGIFRVDGNVTDPLNVLWRIIELGPIKAGRAINRTLYDEMLAEAVNDPDFIDL